MTNDLASRLADITTILNKDFPKNDKVVMSLQKLSGLDITHVASTTEKIIHQHFVLVNAILMKYPITSFDDYAMLSDFHLNKLIRNIKQLCNHLSMTYNTSIPVK